MGTEASEECINYSIKLHIVEKRVEISYQTKPSGSFKNSENFQLGEWLIYHWIRAQDPTSAEYKVQAKFEEHGLRLDHTE